MTIRSPLLVNGLSLAMSSGIASAFGLLYWVIAARLYTVEQVGLNATLISTMATLTTMAQLNLGSVLTRFLPAVGRAAPRWILTSYALTSVACVIFCVLFFLVIRAWIPSLHFLVNDHWAFAWFTLAAIPWAILGLNDWVLAGLRQAVWAPVGATIFAVMKILLLVAFVATSWQPFGPFISWAISAAAVMLLVLSLIFLRLLRAPTNSAIVTVNLRVIVRYIGGDFFGTALFLVTMGLVPIIIMERLGAAATAEYYIVWTISYPLYLVSMGLGTALLAEGAADPRNLPQLSSRGLKHTLLLVGAGAIVLLIATPLVLRLFGKAYAHSGLFLWMLALSSIPYGIQAVYLAMARVEGRMATVVAVQAAMLLLVLGTGIPLLNRFGVLGMGIAWLATQTLLALILGTAWIAKGHHLCRRLEV